MKMMCGAGAPAREKPTANTSLPAIRRPFHILVAALREIFDESSYARFLDRQQRPSTVAAYNDFLRENEAAIARRPKCC